MSERVCLVLLPLRTATLKRKIFQILKSLGMKPLTAKDVFRPPLPVIAKLEETIKKSDFVVADVSGTNPNIMFEIGMCTAYEKPIVILARSRTKVPFDVRDFFIVEYDQTPKGLKKMEMSLRERLSLLSLSDKISDLDVYTSHRKFLRVPKTKARKTEDTVRFAEGILRLPADHRADTSKRFESLVSEMFENEGFRVVSTDEKLTDWPIDLVLQVHGQPGLLFVECKNRNVASKDIASFSQLLDIRHLNKGIIMSTGRVTDGAKERILQQRRLQGIQIIAFDRSDLERVVQGERFKKLLNAKITEAALSERLEK